MRADMALYDAKRQGKACHAGTLSRIVAQTASDA